MCKGLDMTALHIIYIPQIHIVILIVSINMIFPSPESVVEPAGLLKRVGDPEYICGRKKTMQYPEYM